MRRSLLLFATGFLCTLPACADEIFTLTSGGHTVTFTLPDTAPNESNVMAFQYNDLIVTVDGLAYDNAGVDFYTSADDGGMQITVLDPFLLNLEGSQLFTGPTTNPTFASGDYSLTSMFGSTYRGDIAVSVSPVAAAVAPEPSAFALFGTGMLGFAGMLRRRRM